MKIKTVILILIISVFSIGLFFFIKNQSSLTGSTDKIKVVTSIYPLYYFASQIGGDKTIVTNIIPLGAEPHDYEPSTHDITKIEKSDILVLSGSGIEPWGDKIQDMLMVKNVNVVHTAEGLTTQSDPHVWLDPVLAKVMVGKISQALIKVDTKNKDSFELRTIQLEAKFDDLNRDFREGLKLCTQKDIIVSHAAFGYLATRYGFNQIPIAGNFPGEESTAQKLAQISQFAKINNVKFIFYESLVSPKLSETIAKEIGAQTLELNPLEGLSQEELLRGEDYFTIQRDNLNNLKTALGCL